MIACDQYGQTHRLPGKAPRKELMEMFGVRSAERMYRDTPSGPKCVGYIVAGLWCELFNVIPWERKA